MGHVAEAAASAIGRIRRAHDRNLLAGIKRRAAREAECELIATLLAPVKRSKITTAKEPYYTRADLGIVAPIKRPVRECAKSMAMIRALPPETRDKDMITYTRLTIDEFDALLSKRHATQTREDGELMTLAEALALPLNIPRMGRVPRTPAERDVRAKMRKKKKRLTPEDELFLFLYAVTSNITWKRVALEFGISETLIGNTYPHVAENLVLVLIDGPDKTVEWPSEEERKVAGNLIGGMPGIFGYVDGTRVKMRKPTVGQGIQYSGKTKNHCRNIQIVVNLFGVIIAVEPAASGSAHDMTIWKYSAPVVDRDAHFAEGEKLGADPGYIGADPNLDVAPDQSKCKTPEEKRAADAQRRHRFVVEYSIGVVKRNFPMVGCPGSTYTKSPNHFGAAFAAACGLQNFIWKTRGTAPRGEKYLSGAWEEWEEDAMRDNFRSNDSQFFNDPALLDPRTGHEARVVGRLDVL